MLGETLDLRDLEKACKNEDITESFDVSARQTILLKRHLLAEAKSFRDMELLVGAIDNIESASEHLDAMKRYSRHFSI